MDGAGWRLMRWSGAIGTGAALLCVMSGAADAARPRASAQPRGHAVEAAEAPATTLARVQAMDVALTELDAAIPSAAPSAISTSSGAPQPKSAPSARQAASSTRSGSAGVAWGLLLLGGAFGGLAAWRLVRFRRRLKALHAIIRLREQQLSEAREQLAMAAQQRDEANWYLGEARAAR